MKTVKNLSSRLVTLRLNSGQAVILPPKTSLSNVMDQDVEQNAKVQKLIDLGVISIPKGEQYEKAGDKEEARKKQSEKKQVKIGKK